MGAEVTEKGRRQSPDYGMHSEEAILNECEGTHFVCPRKDILEFLRVQTRWPFHALEISTGCERSVQSDDIDPGGTSATEKLNLCSVKYREHGGWGHLVFRLRTEAST